MAATQPSAPAQNVAATQPSAPAQNVAATQPSAPAQTVAATQPSAPAETNRLDDEERDLLAAYGVQDMPELDDEVINSLREMDYSFDPDMEDDGKKSDDEFDEDGDEQASSHSPQAGKPQLPTRNVNNSQKNLAVLDDNHKKTPLVDETNALKMRWKTLVENLKPPLSTMMAHAIVKKFDRNELEIELNDVFKALFTRAHEAALTREIRQIYGWNVRLKVAFSENADDQASLAAESARAEIKREEAEKQALWNHPLFQAVINSFQLQLEPDKVQFTFNSDRISK